MKWSRSKNKKSNEQDDEANLSALVRQDPRTSVKTTSAQSETTNTSTQNATIFNNNKGTVTYQTTKQTVTSHQTARITEMITRRTPTPQELEEMMRLLHMNKKAETKTFTTTTTTGPPSASNPLLRRNRPNNLPALPSSAIAQTSRNSINSISPKSATKFKSTASPMSRLIFNYESNNAGTKGTGESRKAPTTPTLVKTQTTTVTEKNGRTITQHVEEHRIKFDAKPYKLSTPNSPLTRNYASEDSFKFKSSTDARPTSVLALPAPSSAFKAGSSSNTTATKAVFVNNKTPLSTYTSPYTQRALLRGSGTTLGAPTTTTTTTTTKPISSFTSSKAKATTKPTVTTTNTNGSTFSPLFSTAKPSTLFSSWEATAISTPSPPTKRAEPIKSLKTINTTTTPTTSFLASSGKAMSNGIGKPGYAYIINNVVFDNPNNEERIGSAEDVKALVQTFEYYKMKTSVVDNAKVDKIRKLVEKIQNKDYSDYACLVIVILSHGNRHEEIAAKDGRYSIDDHVLFPILRNSSLNDKPKLFFIQACKGSMESAGYFTDAVPFSPPGSASEILKCYSTFEGFVSYRTEKGSIFIQALCQNLKLFGCTKNIKDIMEIVTQIVKQQSQNKQIPAYTSTLTKPFVFGDYVKFSK